MEHTNLLSNSKNNDYVGINLYTDDEASFSGAGINHRASEIAGCCGLALQVCFSSNLYLHDLSAEVDNDAGPAQCYVGQRMLHD